MKIIGQGTGSAHLDISVVIAGGKDIASKQRHCVDGSSVQSPVSWRTGKTAGHTLTYARGLRAMPRTRLHLCRSATCHLIQRTGLGRYKIRKSVAFATVCQLT